MYCSSYSMRFYFPKSMPSRSEPLCHFCWYCTKEGPIHKEYEPYFLEVWTSQVHNWATSLICRVEQKNFCMFEFPTFVLSTNLEQPMHSPTALTEHVSLNFAGLFMLDPVLALRPTPIPLINVIL